LFKGASIIIGGKYHRKLWQIEKYQKFGKGRGCPLQSIAISGGRAPMLLMHIMNSNEIVYKNSSNLLINLSIRNHAWQYIHFPGFWSFLNGFDSNKMRNRRICGGEYEIAKLCVEAAMPLRLLVKAPGGSNVLAT